MIYTFGDGFAAGHIWPEWPQILSAVCNEPVINYGYPGAGNNFIFSTVVEIALTIDEPSTFIVQWTNWNRFDKLLEDDSWNNTIQNDKKYSHAVYEVNNKKWWLSSGSTQMNDYRKKYQQQKQQQLFDIYHMVLLYEFLKQKGHVCFYCLTYDFDINKLTNEQLSLLSQLPWINKLLGMDSVINLLDRGTEIQPLPLGQARWILDFLSLPSLDKIKLTHLIDLISAQQWIPYNPDREEIWTQLVQKLS
jgi:hypothetical protein